MSSNDPEPLAFLKTLIETPSPSAATCARRFRARNW